MRLAQFLIDQKNRITMSKKPIEIEKWKFPNNQFQYGPEGNMKPVGLWYGFGDSWISWCKNNMPDLLGKYHYLIEINRSKVLSLNNIIQLQNFTDNFKSNSKANSGNFVIHIDWQKVSLEWSGLEICPYISQSRSKLELTWYMGWDVASGCIWKKDGIKSFEEINETE